MRFDTSKIKSKHILIAGGLVLVVVIMWYYYKAKKTAALQAAKQKQENKTGEQLSEEQRIFDDFATSLGNFLSLFGW